MSNIEMDIYYDPRTDIFTVKESENAPLVSLSSEIVEEFGGDVSKAFHRSKASALCSYCKTPFIGKTNCSNCGAPK